MSGDISQKAQAQYRRRIGPAGAPDAPHRHPVLLFNISRRNLHLAWSVRARSLFMDMAAVACSSPCDAETAGSGGTEVEARHALHPC